MSGTRDNPVEGGGGVLGAERRLVRTLREIASWADAERTRLDGTRDEQQALADHRLNEQRAAADTARDAAALTADEAFAAARDASDAAMKNARNAADSLRSRDLDAAKERAENDASQSKEKYDEAKWFAETCFDSDRVKLRQLRANNQAAVNRLNAGTEGVRAEAEAVLAKWRQPTELSRAVTAYTGSAPEADYESAIESARRSLAEASAYGLPGLIKGVVPWVVVAGLAVLAGVIAAAVQKWNVTLAVFIAFLGGSLVGGIIVYAVFAAVRRRTGALLAPVVEQLGIARGAASTHAAALAADEQRRALEAKTRMDTDIAAAIKKHETTVSKVQSRLTEIKERVEEIHAETTLKATDRHAADRREAEATRGQRLADAASAHARATHAAVEAHAASAAQVRATHDAGWQTLRSKWSAAMTSIASDRATIETTAMPIESWNVLASGTTRDGTMMPMSDDPTPTTHAAVARLDAGAVLAAIQGDARLPNDVPVQIDLPVPLQLPGAASMLLLTPPEERTQATALLTSAMLRLLTAIPPGKARFTIIDPVGLGQSFAGFMQLSEFATTSGSLVGERIWTEPRHIEQKLADITEHMETVIQKYLRNQYATIDEYNRAAGEVAEPYRFVVIADFPSNFTESSAKRLQSIVASGARCGVYVLIAATRKENMPQGIRWTDLTGACNVLTLEKSPATHGTHSTYRWKWDDPEFAALPITTEDPPPPEVFAAILRRVGEAATEASRVRVPFTSIAPPADGLMTRSSAEGLTIPLGRAGATKLQHLDLGQGTAQHVLIAGRTGSGKSTLLHVMITAGAMWYSPRELEVYLVDFKKGVEFKSYATHGLPHARVIAVESEREFGLSVLRKLDAELTRRGDLFRAAGTQSLAAYRMSVKSETMPRVLLVVDEFQEFFIEDDKLAQEAGLLLDRLVRQGRAFGMHVILGSQTLAGAYSLARSTLGQMGVRIALQCSEADSYLILSDDNPAARLLNRPGEAIYNNASGLLEGNSPFQVCYLDEVEREKALASVRTETSRRKFTTTKAIVFEGNAPAHIEENPELEHSGTTTSGKFHLGAPISIKEPTGVLFRRRSACNLLLIGQNEDQMLGMLAAGVAGLAIQDKGLPKEKRGTFVVIDGTPSDSPLANVLRDVTTRIAKGSVSAELVEYRAVPVAVAKVHAEMTRRRDHEGGGGGGDGSSPLYLVIAGGQRFRALQRSEDDFTFNEDTAPKPDKQLAEIIRDGPLLGVHTILWCDSASNLDRLVKRQTLGEFDARVLLQMSANDSSNLIDSPAAGTLGRDRAILFSEERGTIEKFRPYAIPSDAWRARL